MLAILRKSFILDVLLGSKYASICSVFNSGYKMPPETFIQLVDFALQTVSSLKLLYWIKISSTPMQLDTTAELGKTNLQFSLTGLVLNDFFFFFFLIGIHPMQG